MVARKSWAVSKELNVLKVCLVDVVLVVGARAVVMDNFS